MLDQHTTIEAKEGVLSIYPESAIISQILVGGLYPYLPYVLIASVAPLTATHVTEIRTVDGNTVYFLRDDLTGNQLRIPNLILSSWHQTPDECWIDAYRRIQLSTIHSLRE